METKCKQVGERRYGRMISSEFLSRLSTSHFITVKYFINIAICDITEEIIAREC